MAKKPPDQPEQNPTLNSPGYASTAPISGEERAVAEVRPVRLADGEVVGGRYRVLRYVARGGMGEVYEAEDLELAERVALKTIRAETRDRVAEERFKREIQLSRKVTHPNVCRIFDVGYHAREDGERVVFLTMELLKGETLIERIRREGPIPIAEAGSLLRQIVAGLCAAHQAGVVHRDLKSSNVLLVPRKIGGVRAVVTDFGLAHVLGGGEDRARSLSGSGGIVGTPGYMAPEQVEGGELSERTDLYALGVVMYEMLTAQLPFDGGTPLSIAAKRLTTPAPSPKKLRPDLPARWEKAVLACLERDPAARPVDPRAVAEMVGLSTDSLEEIDGTVRVDKEAPGRSPLLLPAALLLLLALAVVGVQRWRDRPYRGARRAVAAVPFHPTDELTAEQPWIGDFAAELLAIRLGEGQALQSFDTSSVTSSLSDIGVTPGAELAASEIDRLRTILTLDLVVTGRYHIAREDGAVVVDAELLDARSHGVVARVSERGRPDELAALLGRVADRIARAAGVSPSESGRGLGVTLPKRPPALRAYVEAREHYDRREVQEAVASARRGLLEEPEHARLHLLAAEASDELGDDRAAASEAKAALEGAGTLPPREQLFVQAAAAALTRDRAGSIARYQQLRAELPLDADIGSRLVDQLISSGRAGEALKLIDQLHRQQLPRLLGLRLDLLEARAHEALGDLARAVDVAQRAGAVADDLGARIARANARFQECRALAELHKNSEARDTCELAKRTASETGSRRLRALAVDWIANVDFDVGDLEAARRGYEEVLPIFRELGDHTGESAALNNLGNVQYVNDDLEGATKLWQQALDLTSEYQDVLAGAPTRENLGAVYQERLEPQQALSFVGSALEIWRAADESDSLARATCRLGGLYLDYGRGREADQQLEQLEQLEARLGTPPVETDCEDFRAQMELGRGHVDRAIAILRAIVDRLARLHTTYERDEVGLELAGAQADSGDITAALHTLDSLATDGVTKKTARTVRRSKLLRLRLELLSKTATHAPQRLRAAEEDLKNEKRKRARLVTSIELERVRALVGDRAGAARRLHALLTEANAAGSIALALDAQLRETQVLAEAGQPPTRAFAVDYGQRARAAGRPAWAEQVERLAEPARPRP
jgi:tetratricopeptide (TPR) repeat protein/tRNA A-37 threonylcarbamoyl transferase component Bud32